MKYRNQLKDIRKWSLEEAGYNDDLSAEDKIAAKKLAEKLYQEALEELEELEAEEDDMIFKHEIKYKRNWDSAA
jgi:hypothetical protein